MAKKEETGLVATTGAKVPAAMMDEFEGSKGEGHDGADSSCYAIPFLRILQALSPQCTKGNAEFIKGAEAGMFFDTVSKELYDGDVGLDLVPSSFKKAYIEWATRADGGGFRGEHAPESNILAKTTVNDLHQNELEGGNIVVDTRTHFCMMAHPASGALRPVVVALASTQMKKSKQWLTNMRSLLIEGKSGPVNPPTYAQIYHVTTVAESNSKGSWFGWKIEYKGLVGDIEALTQTKAFNRQVKSDAVQIAYDSGTADTSDDEKEGDGPF